MPVFLFCCCWLFFLFFYIHSFPMFCHRWQDNVLSQCHVVSHAPLLLTWSCDQTALDCFVSSSSAIGPRSKTLRPAAVHQFRLPHLDARLITQTHRWPSAKSHALIHFREAPESVATGFLLLFRAAKPIRAKRLCNRWANVGMSQQKPESKSLQCCKLEVGEKNEWAHSVNQT